MNFLEYVDSIIDYETDYVLIDESEINEYDLESLDERIVKQRVVRGGKRKFKFQTTKPGFKVIINKEGVPKEILISPKEKIAREMSQKRAARIRKIKQDPAQEKRAASIKRKEIIKKTSSELAMDKLIQKKRQKERDEREKRAKLRGDVKESFTGFYYEV